MTRLTASALYLSRRRYEDHRIGGKDRHHLTNGSEAILRCWTERCEAVAGGDSISNFHNQLAPEPHASHSSSCCLKWRKSKSLTAEKRVPQPRKGSMFRVQAAIVAPRSEFITNAYGSGIMSSVVTSLLSAEQCGTTESFGIDESISLVNTYKPNAI